MDKIEIKAVYEDDLPGMMKSLGMWEAFLKGELYCPCGNQITEENLTAFKKIDGKPQALCSLFCGKVEQGEQMK